VTCAEAVRAFLLTLTPVTTLVPTKDITSARFHQSPSLPAVCVFQISDVQQSHLRGTSGAVMARIQIDVIASTMSMARQIDQAVMGDYVGGTTTGLRGATFSVGSPSWSVKQAQADSYRESYEAEEMKQYRVSRDYRVWYEG
jgi:hypothetical protein